MTIYLDIIFVENILMNYIILFATFIIVKSRAKHLQLRMILSSIIGSIYAIIVYLNILPIYSHIIAKFILSIAMVYIAFEAPNIKKFIKDLLTFYLVSFIFGGCTFALIYFIKPENAKMNNGVFVGLYPIKVALIAGIIAFIVTQIVFKLNKTKLNGNNTIVNIKISVREKNTTVKALVDSGNMLQDPINKRPVIVVEKKILEKIIEKNDLENILQIMGGEAKEHTSEYLSRVRMIPFMSLGKENGMLIGIRLDKVEIKMEDACVERENIVAGIYNKKLTKDDRYNALIGLNLMEGEDKNEFITSVKK